jgi:hypothetical protein
VSLTQHLKLVAGIVGALALLGVVLQVLLPYVYQYRFAGRSVQVTLFGLVPIFSVPYSKIAEARVLSAREAFLANPWSGLRFPSRVVALRPVLIRKDSGLFRKIVFTPSNPESFVSEINQRRLDSTVG